MDKIRIGEIKKLPYVFFILGAPAAGKGSLCKLLVPEYGFVHLPVEELVEWEGGQEGSDFGEQIKECKKEGKPVPPEIKVKIIAREIELAYPKKRFLIDGYPQNLQNVDVWMSIMKNDVNFLGCVLLEVSIDVCFERIKKQQAEEDYKGIVEDDETIRKRLQEYRNDTWMLYKEFRINGFMNPLPGQLATKKVFEYAQDTMVTRWAFLEDNIYIDVFYDSTPEPDYTPSSEDEDQLSNVYK